VYLGYIKFVKRFIIS